MILSEPRRFLSRSTARHRPRSKPPEARTRQGRRRADRDLRGAARARGKNDVLRGVSAGLATAASAQRRRFGDMLWRRTSVASGRGDLGRPGLFADRNAGRGGRRGRAAGRLRGEQRGRRNAPRPRPAARSSWSSANGSATSSWGRSTPRSSLGGARPLVEANASTPVPRRRPSARGWMTDLGDDRATCIGPATCSATRDSRREQPGAQNRLRRAGTRSVTVQGRGAARAENLRWIEAWSTGVAAQGRARLWSASLGSC